MKQFSIFSFIIAFLFSFSSCSNKKSQEEIRAEFQASLTNEDSVQVLKICDDYMNLLKAGNIDDALNTLYEYDEEAEAVNPLSDNTYKKYQSMYKMFPVYDFVREYFSFQEEGLNDVKYKVKFVDSTVTEGADDAFISFMFNPVKVDGTWYLTVKREDQSFDENRR